ncbi:MAG TPA: PAS domain-containing sensor histidine kinase, partial [Ktedonobacter sp.]|nr:PAS domain-containing sensor histidine kinase [Ktedonobacter sp.]
TPLTTIKGNMQLTQLFLKQLQGEETLSSRGCELLENASNLLERALRQTTVQKRLISDILDVSRIQMNKLELSLELCDLVAIVQETVKDKQHSDTAHRLHVELPMQQSLFVMVDADRIGQVINNYITNALKYSRSNQAVVVGIEETERAARVWVRDNGTGLTSEQQQHIWERFYQAPGVPVQSGASIGLGLGLHISHILIERHGGEVGVESTPGEGSTFWFTLPLHQER